MKKTKLTRSLLAACSIVALSAVAYGCSSGISQSEADKQAAEAAAAAAAEAEAAAKKAAEEAAAAAEAEKQAALEAERAKAEAAEAARLASIEDAREAIAAATTASAAQAAKDAVNDVATATEAAELQAAVDARADALATMARADEQKAALMAAAEAIDTSDLTTAANIAAANTAIAALEAALAAAADVSDTDKAMYQAQVTAAETAVATAQSALDHAAQTMALGDAVAAVEAIDLSALSTQEAIDAAEAAIAGLRAALDAATELSDAEKVKATTTLAVASRTVMMAQGTIDKASQQTALDDAVAALDAVDLDNLMTQEQIDAAEEAIVALDLALAAATDLTDAQKLDATVDVTVAKRKVASAQEALDTNVGNQRMALTEAANALAGIDLDDLDTQEKIDAANAAIRKLGSALNGATHLSDSDKAMYQTQLDTATETVRTAETGMARDERMATQRTAITNAVTAATTAVGAVNDTATDDAVTAADTAIADLQAAIDGAEDLPEGDTDVAMAQGTLTALKANLTSAKESRTAALDKAEKERLKAEQEAKEKQDKAMAATATKLYDGIGATPLTGHTVVIAADTGVVSVNPAGDPIPDQALAEDKKTSVAANQGWDGTRHTFTVTAEGATKGNMYEAVVYSNMGDPTPGAKFSTQYADNLTNGVLDNATTRGTPSRVASSSFDQAAGWKKFELPDNTVAVKISGSYHGVSGTYSCVPGDNNTCAVNKAAQGFTLGGVDANNAFVSGASIWTFTPTSLDAKVMSADDTIYATYGWWLHTEADGDLIASAFAEDRGTVPDASGLGTLQGTATYKGGAAGHYALKSSTGGTNDAGQFTAKATLDADFSDNAITGTIDNFMGADGKSRNWSVELKEAAIATGGGISRDAADDTVWTIDGTAAAASGEWSGSLQDNGADGVPKVGSGTFHTTYDGDGRMVGAFGVNKQ